jgi:hypothetical protein
MATRTQQQARTNNKRVWWMMIAKTKKARAARVIVMAMRVPGNKEGKCGKGYGAGDEAGVQLRGRGQQGQ